MQRVSRQYTHVPGSYVQCSSLQLPIAMQVVLGAFIATPLVIYGTLI